MLSIKDSRAALEFCGISAGVGNGRIFGMIRAAPHGSRRHQRGYGHRKELVARAIPRPSKADRRFVTYTVGGVETLFESDFRDHVRGAFTAPRKQAGGCSRRYAGTIFLDAIGELPAKSRRSCPASPRAGKCTVWGILEPKRSSARIATRTATCEAKLPRAVKVRS